MTVNILLCEDDPGMIVILRRFLEPVASIIDVTDTLQGALEKTANKGFNLVILDLLLNGTGKVEALHAIRQLKSNGAAVVVVTGIPEPDLEREAKAAGCDTFVYKSEENFRKRLLLAVALAVLHLPGNRFSDHVELLRQLAAA